MLLQSLKIFLTDSIGVFGELGVLGNRGIRVLGNFYIGELQYIILLIMRFHHLGYWV